VPSHAAKHLNVDPSGAQSESRVHGFEQALAAGVQPASVNAPRAPHDRPAAHSESELQAMPAAFSGLLPHPGETARPDKANARKRVIRIATGSYSVSLPGAP
jgi:hypothetical protein